MATLTLLFNAPDISKDDYCVFGLATCYLKEDGEFFEIQVIEPIPSAALEAIWKGVPTSYELACAKSVGKVIEKEVLHKPSYFPDNAQFCFNFAERVAATVRTYKTQIEVQSHIPEGTFRDDFNYSLERKRVLNAVNVVRKEDNVKQHSHARQIL
ncbi:hypothetical protein [cyanobacterium endosymbiont of Epithemia clementina EcSB]|uniref:hypothetical protein n=1 Tax=cyanobacterium endosymbiont of Epithemia clementina EcSB TaxID=3034674 RepID=UPI0024812994|nr:hypothetical protein [cyanobacterium endosymbiont of Epithemia clementina EcSB]WGT67463.1 hypothetical protein P3F56_09780 [cyanobacterium endosymbiont of Epithemia clementina EcSB]